MQSSSNDEDLHHRALRVNVEEEEVGIDEIVVCQTTLRDTNNETVSHCC